VRGVDLGLVVGVEGVAFAGGVVTDPAGFGAGVGFGLVDADYSSMLVRQHADTPGDATK
jgi:hypothetical protein